VFWSIIPDIRNWKFDPLTSGLTLLFAPLGVYLLLAARRFLKEALKYVVDGLVYALNKTIVHRAAASLTLKRYCRLQLAGSTKYLRIPATAEVSIEIDKIFVPLVLENPGVNAVYNSNSLLQAGNRIRIIGDPGSGKSSAAKRLFRDECARALELPRASRFPVFIELRTLEIPKTISNVKLGEWMLTYIRSLCAKHDVYNLEMCFDAYANKTGLLIILDGLDEVSSAAYPRIQTAINALVIKLQQLGENNVILLTMRTQYHHQIKRDFDDNFPIVLSVKRFAPTDIYEFLIRWPFGATKMENVVRIYNDLTDRPTLREMCTNPLVLSMYVAQDQIGGYHFAPDSRTEFYSKVAEELLIKRRAKQIGSLDAQAIIREQRQRILGMVALEHLSDPEQSANHLLWNTAIRIVMEVTGIKRRSEAEQYLRELSKETGLIGEEQEGESFRFIHLTFCEYFCAHEAVHGQPDGWTNLLNAHKDFQANPALRPRLIEVLPFAAALMPRHMKAQCIDQVAACNDPHLLALTFLETKIYTHDLWPAFVDTSIANLLRSSQEEWNADWLRELHLFLVVASDAERAASVMRGIAKPDGVDIFFRNFAKSAKAPLAKLIRNYAEQDAAAAFRVATLCEVDLLNDVPEIIIESCSQPPFIAVAVERAFREPKNAELWASLFAEGGLRSPAAALALSGRGERPWAEIVARLPAGKRWSYSSFVRDSFYTDCVTIGCQPDVNRDVTPLLRALASVPPPNAARIQSEVAALSVRSFVPLFSLFYFAGPVFIFVDLYSDIELPFNTGSYVYPRSTILLFFLCCALGTVMLASISFGRVQLYQALLNLQVGGALTNRVFHRFRSLLFFWKAKEPTEQRMGGWFATEPLHGEIIWPSFAKVSLFRPRGTIGPARDFFVERAKLAPGSQN
jgi:hypothetical protein